MFSRGETVCGQKTLLRQVMLPQHSSVSSSRCQREGNHLSDTSHWVFGVCYLSRRAAVMPYLSHTALLHLASMGESQKSRSSSSSVTVQLTREGTKRNHICNTDTNTPCTVSTIVGLSGAPDSFAVMGTSLHKNKPKTNNHIHD